MLDKKILNNYQRISIDIVSKNIEKFNLEKPSIRFEGKAHILIEKSSKKIVFNTMLLKNENVWGADDGKYGRDYGIKKYNDLFEIRKKSFNFSIPDGNRKNYSKLKLDFNYLNQLFIKNKLTIKTACSFLSGSQTTGGLMDPVKDPIRLVLSNEYSNKIFDNNVKIGIREWKIYSLLSNIKEKSKNNLISWDITIDDILNIEEIDFSEVFNFDWNVHPYGGSHNEEIWVPFRNAFKSNNSDNLIDWSKTGDVILLAQKQWNEVNFKEYIMEINYSGDRTLLKNQLRGIWKRVTGENINKNEFKKDFVNGLSRFDCAHIIENRSAIDKLQSGNVSIEEKKNYIEKLLDENNFILLDKNIHSLWDGGKIKINENGLIENVSLSEDEFELITTKSKSIYEIYPNVLNNNRKILLHIRYSEK